MNAAMRRGHATNERKDRILSWLLAVVISLSSNPAHQRQLMAVRTTQQATQVHALRYAIRWHRARTWHWQRSAGVRPTTTHYAERSTTSLAFLKWINNLWQRRLTAARRQAARISSASVPALICRVFGSVCGAARSIAWTESRYRTWAKNGQYLGIFQMGSSERETYDTLPYTTAYNQIVDAHNMYLARGFEPWYCCEG